MSSSAARPQAPCQRSSIIVRAATEWWLRRSAPPSCLNELKSSPFTSQPRKAAHYSHEPAAIVPENFADNVLYRMPTAEEDQQAREVKKARLTTAASKEPKNITMKKGPETKSSKRAAEASSTNLQTDQQSNDKRAVPSAKKNPKLKARASDESSEEENLQLRRL